MRGLFSRPGSELTDEDVEALLRSAQGAHIDQMLTYTAVGTPDAVRTTSTSSARTPTPTS